VPFQVAFTVNPVTPTMAGATSDLNINVSPSLAPGTYSFQVTGSPVGATASGATTTITLNVAPFDYSLSNNGPMSITAGNTGPVTITATLKAGSAQPVTLSCSGLPSGITCNFCRARCWFDGRCYIFCHAWSVHFQSDRYSCWCDCFSGHDDCQYDCNHV
jgi:hypothetical protein